MNKGDQLTYYDKRLKGNVLRFTPRRGTSTDYVIGNMLHILDHLYFRISTKSGYKGELSVPSLMKLVDDDDWNIIRNKKPTIHLYKEILKQL